MMDLPPRVRLIYQSPTIMSPFHLFEMTPSSSAQFLLGKDHFCSIGHMILLDQSVLALSADGPLRPRNVFSIIFSFSRNYFSLFHTETAGMSEGYNRVQGQQRCLVFIDGGKEFEIGRNMLEKYGGCVCLSSLEMMII